jgi:hypothetical protein
MKHWKATKKALHYLQGTKHYMLMYKKTDNLEVIDYSDAYFAGYADLQKSAPSYVFTVANGAISWKSSKQKITVYSTMYVEFIACYEAMKHSM